MNFTVHNFTICRNNKTFMAGRVVGLNLADSQTHLTTLFGKENTKITLTNEQAISKTDDSLLGRYNIPIVTFEAWRELNKNSALSD